MMGEQRPTCRVLCACICVLALGVGSIDGAQYNNSAAVEYAQAWWNGANHDCGSSYDACTPWSYWGSEHCGLSSHGGDGANFVSQCLLAAGHPDLVISPCRGYPCGREEIGGITLSTCLYQNYGWKSTCGAHAALPSSIVPGDVLVFHGSSCTDSDTHATLIVAIDNSTAYIASHSNQHWNYPHTNYATQYGYYEWLHLPS